ncbi:MAG: NTP transferase domain-containing protein [Pseudomonadota bacterium]|nr:NTP transferase domain-containing protein [Pseudomonadota bacterium]
MSALQEYLEHPQDVLARWLSWREAGKAALVMVTETEGGAVRERGALMAVSEDGRAAGYISGGCIDADVILQAQQALANEKPLALRYGAGSPFVDLPLPCGGAIEVSILPDPDEAAVRMALADLNGRRATRLVLSDAEARYVPKLRLRIAGRGADPLALARLARASGIETILQLRDGEDVSSARAEGFDAVSALDTPGDLPQADDDPRTAFVLMFHDGDWEGPLLRQALDGPAFYVGAVGSSRTHARRCDALRRAGVNEADIRRIHGPIGLIPSMRDASMLAISTLGEIVAAYHNSARRPFTSTASLLLAAGASSRFERGDKLLAEYKGKPVISRAAALMRAEVSAARIAVLRPDASERADIANHHNWRIVVNTKAVKGQSSSLISGLRELLPDAQVQQALILLADMPDIPEAHLHKLQRAIDHGASAAMTSAGGKLMPPAIFRREQFDALMKLEGDRGARSVFEALENTAVVPLSPELAFDIDTIEDLKSAEEAVHA